MRPRERQERMEMHVLRFICLDYSQEERGKDEGWCATPYVVVPNSNATSHAVGNALLSERAVL